MKTFTQFIAEAKTPNTLSHEAAKRGFDHLMAGASSVGAHKGGVRVYERRKGGSLSNTLVGDYNHFSYAKPSRYEGPGHYFANHYSPTEGVNIYTHVKLKRNHDLGDVEATKAEILKQNPHLAGSGHPHNLALNIAKYHGND